MLNQELLEYIKKVLIAWILYISSVSQLVLPIIQIIAGILSVLVTFFTLVKMYRTWNQKQGN